MAAFRSSGDGAAVICDVVGRTVVEDVTCIKEAIGHVSDVVKSDSVVVDEVTGLAKENEGKGRSKSRLRRHLMF